MNAPVCSAGAASEVATTSGVSPAVSTPHPESSAPMLDVHPLHEPPHTWRGFFIHIATIVVGLVIAVALEQTVLFFHHRHQAQELEEQMRAVFTSDLASSAENSRRLGRLRAYLTELRAAIVARLQGQSDISPPPVDDARMAMNLTVPSMAPLDLQPHRPAAGLSANRAGCLAGKRGRV